MRICPWTGAPVQIYITLIRIPVINKLVFEVTILIQGQIRLSASIYLAATLHIKVSNLLVRSVISDISAAWVDVYREKLGEISRVMEIVCLNTRKIQLIAPEAYYVLQTVETWIVTHCLRSVC